MFNKLRIAGTLLIIGIISGLSIWGTHELTKDDIAANRRAVQYEIYVDMFPDMVIPENIGEITEEIENNIIKEKITVEDDSGNLLGYILKGSETNSQGFIEVIIGVDTSGEIVDVQISSTENTPNYVQTLRKNYIGKFSGQPLQDVSYDANTGSTITYDSIRKMIEASVLLIQGDPRLDAYSNLIESVTRYETEYSFTFGAADVEVELLAEDTVVGYGYEGIITVDDSEYTVAVVIDTDNVFKGFAVVDGEATQVLNDAIASFDSQRDTAIDGLEFTGSNDLENQLAELANIAVMRALEDEETRTLRQYFLEAASLGDEVTINEGALDTVRPVYDDQDVLIGYVYYASAQGYAYYDDQTEIELHIAIDTTGTISSIVVGDHSETPGTSDPAFNALEDLYGDDTVEDYNADDAYSGASVSGNAMRDAIAAALEDANERLGG